MIHIDTLAFVRRLTAAGFEREQAEANVEGLADVDTSGLATKNDLAEPKAELKADIARLEIRLGEFKTELFRHMLVQTGVIVGAVIALMKLLP
jgi:hypothetical protein